MVSFLAGYANFLNSPPQNGNAPLHITPANFPREGLRGETARRTARTGADGGVAGLGGDDRGEQGEDAREEEDACVVDDKGEEERDADEAGAHLEPDALDGVVVLGHRLRGEEEAGDEEREAADHPDEGVQLKEAD